MQPVKVAVYYFFLNGIFKELCLVGGFSLTDSRAYCHLNNKGNIF